MATWVDESAFDLLAEISATALERDRAGTPIPREYLVEAARSGLLAASLPRSVGGAGLSLQSWGRALERVGYLCDDASFTLLISLFQAVGNMLLRSEDRAVLDEYVVPCSLGTRLVAFAYTEDSDAFSLASTARPYGEDYIVDGSKVMVTAGSIADAYMTYVVNTATGDMAVVLIDRQSPGVTVHPIETMGLRGSGLAALSFDSVRIPRRHVVSACNGLDHLQGFLNPRRAILSCAPIGRMARIATECVRYLSTTVRYGAPLTSMQLVQARLGKMQMAVYTSQALIDPALSGLDAGTTNPLFDEVVSTAKHQITEHALSVSLDALRLTGARGYASSLHLERYVRDFCGMISGAGAQDVLAVNLGALAIGRARLGTE